MKKSLFPGQIQPFIAILANTVFNILVRLKICKAQPKRYNVGSSFGSGGSTSSSVHQSHITITIPLITQNAADNTDAERRRTKALKALKERLKKPGDDEEQLKSPTSDWSLDTVQAQDTATVTAATSMTAMSAVDETSQPDSQPDPN